MAHGLSTTKGDVDGSGSPVLGMVVLRRDSVENQVGPMRRRGRGRLGGVFRGGRQRGQVQSDGGISEVWHSGSGSSRSPTVPRSPWNESQSNRPHAHGTGTGSGP